MPSSSIFAQAIIVGGRWRHDMENDHFGTLPDVSVVLSAPVSHWPEGTPVHVVIAGLYDRIIAATSANRHVGGFTVDAYIDPNFLYIDAVIEKTLAGSFTADAIIDLVGTKTFTVDAVLRALALLTIDALIV